LDGDLVEEGKAQTKWSGGQNLNNLAPTLPPSWTREPLGTVVGDNVSPADPNQDISEQDPLYLAQIRKLQHIIKKLHIPPSSNAEKPVRVLEIGSGWGALAIRIAQQYPHVEIDTITLSSEQQVLAEKRIAMHGLENRIKVHLMDYRNMPSEWEGRFSRFVSIEMIEAVGREFLEEYWKVVDWAMEKKGAMGVVQVITLPEASELFWLCSCETVQLSIDIKRTRTIHPGNRFYSQMGALLPRDEEDLELIFSFVLSFRAALIFTRVRPAADISSHICKELTIHIV
jgi:cyclopropane-fatty-acyl-phospholipid synthase